MRQWIKPVLLTGTAAAAMSFGAWAQDAPPPSMAVDQPTTEPTMELKEQFGELDGDGDGRISRSELSGDASLQQRFDRIDLDRDGYVTRAELFAEGSSG